MLLSIIYGGLSSKVRRQMSAAGSFRPDLPCRPAEYGISHCIEPDASAASAANLFSDNGNALSGQYLPGDVIVCAVCFNDLCAAENLCTIVSRVGIPLHNSIAYIILSRQ
jgi:hypothetical protein